jgi:RNA polymerase sigma factor (sigma-70 family)
MYTSPFPKTSWSLVYRAGASSDPRALGELCEAYWFPVYAFVRRRVGSAEDARDVTQGFFARLIEKNDLQKVDRKLGRKFRSWLLACVTSYLANKHDYDHARIRDPGRPIESLDAIAAEARYGAEPAHHVTPEILFARAFTLDLLARVLELLRLEYASGGNEPLFDALKGCLSGDVEIKPYKEIAAVLGKTEGAVKKAAHDLRGCYRRLLRAEVACLLADPYDEDAVEEELRQLLAALDE